MPEVIAAGRHSVAQMAANRETWFRNPNPPLEVLSLELDNLVMAESTARTGAKGAAQARDKVLAGVHTMLDTERQTVQSVADANKGREVEIAAAAGMVTRKAPVRPEKEPIKAEGTGTPGEALLNAKSVDNAGYEWQKSADKGTSYSPAGYSTFSHITLKGLVSGAEYKFRVRPVIGETPGEWIESKEFKVP